MGEDKVFKKRWWDEEGTKVLNYLGSLSCGDLA
jgi:hypothetical protein